jgi:DNA repair protein RadC
MQCTTRRKKVAGDWEVAPIFRAILDAESEMDQAKEHFWALMLDTKMHVLRVELIALGLLDQCTVHPREVFRPAVGCSAKTVIVCHNHPNGDPEPSDKDIALTLKLKEAGNILGIEVLDHIVVGEGASYSSIRNHMANNW